MIAWMIGINQLSLLCLQFQTPPQPFIKFSPYEVAYGRKVTFPIQHALMSEHTIPADGSFSNDKLQ